MPPLLTTRPGAAFISDVSSRSRRPADHLGVGEHRVADDRQVPARAPARGSPSGTAVRVREERVGAGDLAQREGVGRDAAAVDAGPELGRRVRERARDGPR